MPTLSILEAQLPEVTTFYEDQIKSPGWDQLGRVFGLELTTGPPEEYEEHGKEILERRAAEITTLVHSFDTRNTEERQGAPVNEYVERFVKDPERRKEFYSSVGELGLIGTQFVNIEQGGLRIVGGAAVDSLIMRSLHTQGRGNIAYVGTDDRVLEQPEHISMARYFPNVEYRSTEAGALHGILEHLHPDRQLIQGDDHLRLYETPTGLVYWAAAPISHDLPELADDPEKKRAATADTYLFLGEQLGPDMGNTVTVSTNDIYVPFQGVDGIHILKGIHGIPKVYTLGFTPEDGARMVEAHFNLPTEPKTRRAGQYAQEVRSLARSLARLKISIARSRLA